MGTVVKLYSFDYNGFVRLIQEYFNVKDIAVIEDVLALSGNKVGDKYIILDNEFLGEDNAYYGLDRDLEKAFGKQKKGIDFYTWITRTKREILKSSLNERKYSIWS